MAKRLASKQKKNKQKVHQVSLCSLICTFAVLFLMVYFVPKNQADNDTEATEGFQISMIGNTH
jgi:hypothetical protein